MRDVTDREARVAELEREREMLDSLLEYIPMSIYFTDRKSRHERVSTNMLCSHPDSFITSQERKRHAHPEDIVGVRMDVTDRLSSERELERQNERLEEFTAVLALAIVRNIADAHSWSVATTDSAEGGARFEFTDVVRVGEGANEHF